MLVISLLKMKADWQLTKTYSGEMEHFMEVFPIRVQGVGRVADTEVSGFFVVIIECP